MSQLNFITQNRKGKHLTYEERIKLEALRKMGRSFSKTFKTITCDNGCENLDFEVIENSVRNKRNRTKVYYAHPYSSWERGTNENINKMIRRLTIIPEESLMVYLQI